MTKKPKRLQEQFIVEAAPATTPTTRQPRFGRVKPTGALDRLEWVIAEADANMKRDGAYSVDEVTKLLKSNGRPSAVIRLNRGDLLLLRNLARWAHAQS